MALANRCPYCGAKLADDGFCSKPCKPGELDRKVAEEKKAQPQPAQEQGEQ